MWKWLSWIEFSICWWHLMRNIATSNWFMDWQKYPKSRTSIKIWQPETLDSIKCHTFPGMGGRTLDILLHPLNSSIFFVPKVLNFNWTGLLKKFYCALQWRRIGFYGLCVHEPASLGNTELTNLQDILTPGLGLRLFWADCFGKACFATDLGFKEIHVDARAGYVMAARGAGDVAGPAPCHQPSESGKAIHKYCDY